MKTVLKNLFILHFLFVLMTNSFFLAATNYFFSGMLHVSDVFNSDFYNFGLSKMASFFGGTDGMAEKNIVDVKDFAKNTWVLSGVPEVLAQYQEEPSRALLPKAPELDPRLVNVGRQQETNVDCRLNWLAAVLHFWHAETPFFRFELLVRLSLVATQQRLLDDPDMLTSNGFRTITAMSNKRQNLKPILIIEIKVCYINVRLMVVES